MREILRGVKYALVVNLIIVLVPITVGLLDIAQAHNTGFYSSVYSGFHNLAQRLACHTVFLGCPDKLAYTIFALEWVILTAVVYVISIRKSYSGFDRKRLLLGFAVAFPFASHLMIYPMEVILFIAETLKLGFV